MTDVFASAGEVYREKHGEALPDQYAREARRRWAEGEELYGNRYLRRDNMTDCAEEQYDAGNYYAAVLAQHEPPVLTQDAWEELRMMVVGAIAHEARGFRNTTAIKRFCLDNQLRPVP